MPNFDVCQKRKSCQQIPNSYLATGRVKDPAGLFWITDPRPPLEQLTELLDTYYDEAWITHIIHKALD